MFIRKFELSVVFIFVVDKDVNFSTLEVDQVKRSDCYLYLSTSIKDHLWLEEAQFRPEFNIFIFIFCLRSVEAIIRG